MAADRDPARDISSEGVGIDDDTRLVYRYVLAQGTVRVEDVAQDVPLEGNDTAAMLARLRAAGLINRTSGSEGEYTAVDPRIALRTRRKPAERTLGCSKRCQWGGRVKSPETIQARDSVESRA